MKYRLKITDLIFDIDTYSDETTEKKFEPYLTEDTSEAHLCITCTLTDERIKEPESTKLTEREEVNWYSSGEGCYSICFNDFINDIICARIDYNNNKKKAEVYVYDVKKHLSIDGSAVLCNVLERVFRLALVFNGGFVMHASSIVHDGYGIAFSAESGTGKSTHTGLWMKVYPQTYILNDDAPALRKNDGTWYIYGTPWAGTTGINCNTSVPLKAAVFLERSEVNKIRPCSALEGIKRLFEAIIHPVSDELVNITLSAVSDFISTAQICVLGCNMTDDAPKTVKEYLYRKD